ncbi:MAG: hypothetical protein AABY11_01310, partial [archaeon]
MVTPKRHPRPIRKPLKLYPKLSAGFRRKETDEIEQLNQLIEHGTIRKVGSAHYLTVSGFFKLLPHVSRVPNWGSLVHKSPFRTRELTNKQKKEWIRLFQEWTKNDPAAPTPKIILPRSTQSQKALALAQKIVERRNPLFQSY